MKLNQERVGLCVGIMREMGRRRYEGGIGKGKSKGQKGEIQSLHMEEGAVTKGAPTAPQHSPGTSSVGRLCKQLSSIASIVIVCVLTHCAGDSCIC